MFIFLGALSYSIYISHAFVIGILGVLPRFFVKYGYAQTYFVNERFYIDFGNPLLANLYLLANLCVVVAFAYLLHKYIEKPCIAFGKNLINKRT